MRRGDRGCRCDYLMSQTELQSSKTGADDAEEGGKKKNLRPTTTSGKKKKKKLIWTTELICLSSRMTVKENYGSITAAQKVVCSEWNNAPLRL